MTPTALERFALKISIILSVLVLGLRATLRDATYLFRSPGKVVRAPGDGCGDAFICSYPRVGFRPEAGREDRPGSRLSISDYF